MLLLRWTYAKIKKVRIQARAIPQAREKSRNESKSLKGLLIGLLIGRFFRRLEWLFDLESLEFSTRIQQYREICHFIISCNWKRWSSDFIWINDPTKWLQISTRRFLQPLSRRKNNRNCTSFQGKTKKFWFDRQIYQLWKHFLCEKQRPEGNFMSESLCLLRSTGRS